MMKPQVISKLFNKYNYSIMHDLLSYITANTSTKILQETDFIIKYNPFGGYYNLLIKCCSIINTKAIEKIIKVYRKERGL